MAGPLGLGRKFQDWKHLSRILFFYPKCMCVCIYLCIHVFLCIHVCTSVYMGTCTCIFMCMHACVHLCMCTCMYSACINVCMCMCICVVYVCAYMYMCVHIEIRGQPQMLFPGDLQSVLGTRSQQPAAHWLGWPGWPVKPRNPRVSTQCRSYKDAPA